MDEELETITPLTISESLLSVIPETGHLLQAVTCRVCYEILQAPVITSCSHTFCSLCIRKYLQYKPQCPACLGTTYEQNLRSNKLAEEFVGHFRQLIEKGEELVNRKGTVQVNKAMKENVLPSGEAKKDVDTVKIRSPSKTALKVLSEDNNAVIHEKTALKGLSEDNNAVIHEKREIPDVIIPKPTGLIKKTSSDKQLEKTASSSSIKSPHAESKSTCPVCNVEVPTQNLNKHVNFCLSNKDRSPVVSRVTRKPLPKLVYALLKDSDLRKRCKEVGLNTKGDKRTLTARHQKYTLLYNTECDMDNPKSKMEIVMQVEREEAAEKRGAGATSSSTKTMLGFDRKTDPSVIEEKQKQYLQQNKSSFHDLIEKAKQNRKRKNEVKKNDASKDEVKNSEVAEVVDISEDSNSASAFVKDPSESLNPSILVQQESSPAKFSKLQSKEVEDSIIEQTKTISKVRLDSSNNDKVEDMESMDYHIMDTIESVSEIERTPKKQSTSSSLYLTPKKETIEKLLKSPSYSQMSIAQSLNQSAKRSEKMKKVECPGGCGLQVTEQYLNIHLDKCLRQADSSPVFESKRNATKSKVGGKLRGKNIRVIGVMPKTHDISYSSDSETSDVDQQQAKRSLRKRIAKKPIIDSDDDEEKEDSKSVNQCDLPVVDVSPMSPNLLDVTADDVAVISVEETIEGKSQVEDNTELGHLVSTCSYKSKDMFDDDSDFNKSTDDDSDFNKSTDVDEPTPPMIENKFVENPNDETHSGDVTGEFMDVDDLDGDIQDLIDAALDVENTQRKEAPTSPVNWSTPAISSTAKDQLRTVSSPVSGPTFITARDHLKAVSSPEKMTSSVTAKDSLKVSESCPTFVSAKDHLRTVSSAESFSARATLTAAAKFEISQENPTARGRKSKENAGKRTSQCDTEKSENEVERRSLRLRKKK